MCVCVCLCVCIDGSETRRRQEESEARRREKEDNAIPAGASVERLVAWSQMVEAEMSTLARRFFFLLGAWFRLQARLLRGQLKLITGRRGAV